MTASSTSNMQEYRDELQREYDGDEYNEPFPHALARLNEARQMLESLIMEVLHEEWSIDGWYRGLEMTLNILKTYDRDWYNAWVDAHPDTGLQHA